MESIIYFFIILLTFSSCSSDFTQKETYRTALWSLRCLYEGFEACDRHLSGIDFKDSVKFKNLESIFAEQSSRVKESFVFGNFTGLQENELCSISTPLLLLIPVNQLALLGGDTLAKLLTCHSLDLSVIQQIAYIAGRSNSSNAFYRTLQSVSFPEPPLRILGRSVTHLNNATSLQIFLSERESILEYFTPVVIATNPTKMLSYVRNVPSESWATHPVDVKRIWAFFLVNSDYPTAIVLWDDKTLEKWGHMLIGATGDELKSLQASNIRNRTVFLEQDFSVFQLRYIFDDFYGSSNLTSYSTISTYKRHFTSLLPRQVQRFYAEAINFKTIEDWQRIPSLATAKQIVEHVVKSEVNSTLDRFLAKGENILRLGSLSFCLPLRFFDRLKTKFSLKDLVRIQHEKMTRAQIFYLTGRGTAFDGDANSFSKATYLLRGLPASYLAYSRPSGYENLLTSLPANSPTRTAALLQAFWDKLVEQNILRLFVLNPDFQTYFDFFPSRFYTFHGDVFINSLLRLSTVDDTADRIPDLVLSSLLAKYHKSPISWKIVDSRNGTTSQDFLLHGITCLDIEAMDPLDFMFVISRFNQRRKSVGKLFPENLQLCCIDKLHEYLYMKSSFMPLYQDQSLLALLTPADIQSLGGFILTGLPVDDLHMAAHRNLIVQTIGSLSLPELMAAAPLEKLLRITELFIAEEIGLDIFDLGNLTHFLSVHSINELKGPAFKLLLESNLLDKRVCATDGQRSAWAYLIIGGFGEPEKWTAQDLITLGDMLFVMPYSEMERISKEAWADAADVIAASTRYVEEIHWPHPNTPFYQACRFALKEQYEGEQYIRELSQYIGWLLMAARYQLDTVIPAQLVKSNYQHQKTLVSTSARSATTPVKVKEDYSSWWRRIFTVMGTRKQRDLNMDVNLTCDAIRVVGKSSELFLSLGLLEKMSDSDLMNCLDELSQMDLSYELTNHIWRRVVMKDIVLTGKLSAAIDPKDLITLNVTSIDMASAWGLELVSILGRYNMKIDTVSHLINQLEGINGNVVTVEQLVALGPLSCKLTKLKAMITATVFFRASRYLGSILPCDHGCLGSFSHFLEDDFSYGPVVNWTSEDIESMGIFVSALNDEKWSVLVNKNPKSLSRLGIKALNCLEKNHIEVLTAETVSFLPLNTARDLMESRSMHLNDSVRTTLSQRIHPQYQFTQQAPDLFESSSPNSKSLLFFIASIVIIPHFLAYF